MKSKLLILSLVIWVGTFAQSVPNTNTFRFSQVAFAVYGDSTAGRNLDSAFVNSNAAYFDATYGSKTMSPKTMLGFRNYNCVRPSGLTSYSLYANITINGVNSDFYTTEALAKSACFDYNHKEGRTIIIGAYTGQATALTAGNTVYLGATTNCNLMATGYYLTNTGLIIDKIVHIINGVVQSVSTANIVGDYVGGGIIAYYFVSGDYGYVSGASHGIIMSTSDLSDATWGCEGTLITGADYYEIGRAASNTSDIISGCATANIAADLCADYTSGIYSDWYLPTQEDFKTGFCWIGNNTTLLSGEYWTSTEDNANLATSVIAGVCNGSISTLKSATRHVRAIRYF